MESQTIGSFVKEKLTNMAKWITEEVGKENLQSDFVVLVENRTEIEVMYIVSTITKSPKLISHKDWLGLMALLVEMNLPNNVADVFAEVVQVVRSREEMHDKFWRYCEMFRDVINSDNEVE